MLVQVDLRCGDRHLTCWVEHDKKVRVGNRITLKNHERPKMFWDVLRVGEPREAAQINRGWNNNI